jgi:hypothetical protein
MDLLVDCQNDDTGEHLPDPYPQALAEIGLL